jgi:hypothetical protein
MSNTLSDKTNKSIADIANKIMQEQPTKMRDFSDTKPIESDMVQRVMNLKVPNHFVKEEVEQDVLKARQKLMKAKGVSTGNPIADRARKVKRLMDTFPMKKEEVEQIDEALDHEVNNYAKHMLNAHSADDLHVGNEHRDMAHQTLKHIEKHYGPVGVRWAEARAGEHIENHNKAQRETEKAHVMKYYKPTPPGAKVYQYPKSEVKENDNKYKPEKKPTEQEKYDKPNKPRNPTMEDVEQVEEGIVSGVKNFIKKYKNYRDAMKNGRPQIDYREDPVKAAAARKKFFEDSEQIDEARFGKAIDRSKLSAAARARLEARDKKAGKEAPKAEPAPTSAAVGKRAGRAAPKAKESPMAALAQSFGAKKKVAPKAEPEDETPAQKVRRQNMERQKEYYAKGGNRTGMNVGSGGRTSITGHNTSTAGGAVAAVKSQGRIKTGGLHSIAVDEELKGNQTALDVAKPYGKLTAQDFKALRAKHKKGN